HVNSSMLPLSSASNPYSLTEGRISEGLKFLQEGKQKYDGCLPENVASVVNPSTSANNTTFLGLTIKFFKNIFPWSNDGNKVLPQNGTVLNNETMSIDKNNTIDPHAIETEIVSPSSLEYHGGYVAKFTFDNEKNETVDTSSPAENGKQVGIVCEGEDFFKLKNFLSTHVEDFLSKPEDEILTENKRSALERLMQILDTPNSTRIAYTGFTEDEENFVIAINDLQLKRLLNQNDSSDEGIYILKVTENANKQIDITIDSTDPKKTALYVGVPTGAGITIFLVSTAIVCKCSKTKNKKDNNIEGGTQEEATIYVNPTRKSSKKQTQTFIQMEPVASGSVIYKPKQ
ncbi:MAG: hypothetical protein OXD32_02920, partial [Endozoicomonadaceae bacterium]|nr:hypothetical protein [Endozoicomonadaceae bacterium]